MIQQRSFRRVLPGLLVESCLVVLHLSAMTVVTTYLIDSAIGDLGLAGGGHIDIGRSGDLNFAEVPVIVTLPLILIEAAATLWRRWWVVALGGLAAVAAAFVHGWCTALVVGMRFWGDNSPVTRSDISDAIATGTFIVVLHLIALVACIALLSQLRWLVRSLRAATADGDQAELVESA